MKSPLNYQVTEYDCAPITFQNAISYLIDREEIDPEVIKNIYKFSLDTSDEKGKVGCGGTSKNAIIKLIKWLINYYENKNLNIKFDYLKGEDVIFEKLYDSLNEKKSCAIIRCWQDSEHYVLVTKINRKGVYLFDPYYLNKNAFKKDKDVLMISNKPFMYNRLVSIKRVFSETKEDFTLGEINKRECILISKI